MVDRFKETKIKLKFVKKFTTAALDVIKLRKFQKRIVKRSLRNHKLFGFIRVYWVVPMGGGKTYMGLSILHSLFKNKLYQGVDKITIITYIGSAQAKWVLEVDYIFSKTHNVVVIDKQPLKTRVALWFLEHKTINKTKPTIFLVRIDTLSNDSIILNKILDKSEKTRLYSIGTLLIDEAHTLLNHKTKRREKIKSITHIDKCHNIICMTGTDQSRGLSDIWSILNILDDINFKSYWKFRSKWLHVRYSDFGNPVHRIFAHKKEALLSTLNHLYFFVTEEEASKYIPSKIRQVLRYDLDTKTRLKYDYLQKYKYVEFEKGTILKTQGTLVTTTRLQQLTCTPYLLTNTLGYGSGLEAIEQKVLEISKENKKPLHFMVGTAFSSAEQYIVSYFEREKSKVQRVIHIADHKVAYKYIHEFEQCKKNGISSVLVVSINKSIGWDLPSCDLAFALVMSYNDNINKQWEDRMARGKATKTSQIFYAIANNTTNIKALEIVNTKNKDTQKVKRNTVINKIT